MSHRGICIQNHFIIYFRAHGVKQGVKRSGNLQGTRIFRFGPLFFSQNWRIFKNVQNSTKNHCFGVVFQSLFNFGWKLSAQTYKFKFLEGFRFFWHPGGHSKTTWTRFWPFLTTHPPHVDKYGHFIDHLPMSTWTFMNPPTPNFLSRFRAFPSYLVL